MTDIADILKRMDSYRGDLPISGQACLDELSDAIHTLQVENDNQDSTIAGLREQFETYRETVKQIAAVRESTIERQRSQLVNDQWQPIETAPKDGTWLLVWEAEINTKYHPAEVARFINGHWQNSAMKFTNAVVWKPAPTGPTSQPDNHQSAPVVQAAHNSGEGEPAETPAYARAGTSAGEEAIKAAANEAQPGARIVRRDGDFLVYYSGFNLSKFVRFLALTSAQLSTKGD